MACIQLLCYIQIKGSGNRHQLREAWDQAQNLQHSIYALTLGLITTVLTISTEAINCCNLVYKFVPLIQLRRVALQPQLTYKGPSIWEINCNRFRKEKVELNQIVE